MRLRVPRHHGERLGGQLTPRHADDEAPGGGQHLVALSIAFERASIPVETVTIDLDHQIRRLPQEVDQETVKTNIHSWCRKLRGSDQEKKAPLAF